MSHAGPSIETAVAPPVPAGRRAVLYAVRRRGDATVEDVAGDVGISESAARQHLSALVDSELVAVAADADEPARRGRPRLTYHVTEAGDGLFPKAYGALTNELLGYIAEVDAGGIDRLFARRRDKRIATARERMAGCRSFEARIATLTRILDDDGYLASYERLARDRFLVVEHNCAIAVVAGHFGQACVSEIEFIRAVLPDAEVTRMSHMANGDRHCAYDIRRRR